MFPPAGFPHSGIQGSQPVCGSPRLIAAYRALHRLRVPRHPPLAFARLTTSFMMKHSTYVLLLIFRSSTRHPLLDGASRN